MHRSIRLLAVIAALPGAPLGAQQPVSRAQAVEAALTRGPRLAAARADTTVAAAQLLTARAFPNPGLATTYSKAVPQFHIVAELPLDLGGIRATRIRSAESARAAAGLRYRFARAAVVFEADTAYTRALAAAERARLSRRTALAADSLRRIAELRRDAGDASELDVQLATVSAGQQANLALGDSLTFVAALLDLQTLMGIPTAEGGGVSVALADSLTLPPAVGMTAAVALDGGTPLQLAAAEQSLRAAEYGVRQQRRSVFTAPSVQAGIETGDPTGSERGILPTVGFTIPLPLLNRNRGGILAAEAERERARAELALARLESRAQIDRAVRERTVAIAKVERDRQLLASANRVASMSLRAYQEGEVPLANVLESQRTAREVLAQYVDDLASAWIATSAVRLFTLSASARP